MNRFTKYSLAGELETTVSGKLLYLFLLDTVDANGKISISQRRVSESLGLSRGTVSRNLRRLYKRGYIDIQPQFHEDGGRAANKYIVFE
jgi:DNA-binding MarR family transcriptional regulator